MNKTEINKNKDFKIKTKKISDKLEFEVKKQEEDLNFIKNLISNKSLLNKEIENMKKKNKANKLKPIEGNSSIKIESQKLNEKSKSVVKKNLTPLPNKNKKAESIIENKKHEKINEKSGKTNLETPINIEDQSISQNKSFQDNNKVKENNENSLRRTVTKLEKIAINCDYKTEKEDVKSRSNSNEFHENTNNTSKLQDKSNEIINNKDNEFLIEFLNDIGLMKYYILFLENNLVNLESLFLIEDEDLVRMNIPIGHCIKIKKKISYYYDLYSQYIELESSNPIMINEGIVQSNKPQQNLINNITEIGTSTDDLPREKKTQKRCWDCLKLINMINEVDSNLYSEDKSFCSEECYKNYLNQFFNRCTLCSTYIEKGKSTFNYSNYFCGQECLAIYEKKIELIENPDENDKSIENYDNDNQEEDVFDPMLDL